MIVRTGVAALCIAVCCAGTVNAQDDEARGEFRSIHSLDTTVVVEMAYIGSANFVGQPIDGYNNAVCLLATPVAEALGRVQAELEPFGLGLKVFDCYRPQRAVDHFVRWGRDVGDQRMKRQYYPEVDKSRVFTEGYIATRSGHSRGGTVDLTLVYRNADIENRSESRGDCRTAYRVDPRELDMGTGYDCFDPLSHTENPHVSVEARKNRLLLRSIMEKYGFDNYSREWWHFTYRAEPFRDRYFDFPVE